GVRRGVQHGVAKLALDGARVGLEQPGTQVLAQLGQRVEAGRVDSEVVIDLRQHLLPHLRDADREDRVAPSQLRRAVLVRETQLECALLAGARAKQSLLESGNQAAGTELDQLGSGLPALDRLAGHRGGGVARDTAPVARGALARARACEPLTRLLDLKIDRLLVDRRLS